MYNFLWCYRETRDVFLDCLKKLPSNDKKLLDQFIMDLKLEDISSVNSSNNRFSKFDSQEDFEYCLFKNKYCCSKTLCDHGKTCV